jgi:hypothetical protein
MLITAEHCYCKGNKEAELKDRGREIEKIQEVEKEQEGQKMEEEAQTNNPLASQRILARDIFQALPKVEGVTLVFAPHHHQTPHATS